MGLPVNNFTFWSYLENKNKEPWQNELKKIRKKFSLFGYIVHDPDSKDGFGDFLGERFSQLSRMTGTDFLFTAFVNPPRNFDNKDEFDPSHYYLADQILNSDNVLKSNLGSFYAISISEYLGINTNSLPYIIITDDPTQNRFYFIELNKQNLFEVMSDLTFIASKIEINFFDMQEIVMECIDFESLYNNETESNPDSDKTTRNSENLDDWLGRLKHPIFKIKLRQSLAQALLRISYKLQRFAINQIQVNNILLHRDWEDRVRQELSEIQKIEFQGAQILYDYLKGDGGALFKADLLKNKENLLRVLLELQETDYEQFKNSIEPDTLSILLDAALLNSTYNADVFLDASPFILPFGKAFEKEMTYSLVHWIRENLAIDLPEYFYKYQPGKRAILQNDQSSFDYNQLKRKTTVWFPPMIGGQIYGLKIIFNQKSIQPFKNSEESDAFFDLGIRIMAIRNQASHLGLEGAASLRAIIHAWRSLWKEGYLEQLNRLKINYRKV